jgi:hypothetical protein
VLRLRYAMLTVGLFCSRPAGGQSPNGTCGYDACSLRLEGNSLVRGQSQTVGRIGALSAVSVAPLILASSDSALMYAEMFDRNYAVSARTVAFGAVMIGAGLAMGLNDRNSRKIVEPGLVVAGAGAIVTLVGAPKLRRAQIALARAIWWHNRGLAPGR